MNSFNKPLIGMINKYLGPKVAALITGASVLGAQFTEFYTSITASLPFSPDITELVKQFALDNSLVSLLPAPLLALATYYFRRAPHNDEINDIIRKEEDAVAYEKEFARDILNGRREASQVHVDMASGPGNDKYVDAGLEPGYEETFHDIPDPNASAEDRHYDYIAGEPIRTNPPMDAAEAKERIAEREFDNMSEKEQFLDHERSQLDANEIDPNYDPVMHDPDYDHNMAILARKERDELAEELSRLSNHNKDLKEALKLYDDRMVEGAIERAELRDEIEALKDSPPPVVQPEPAHKDIVEMQDNIIKQIEGDYVLPLEERVQAIRKSMEGYDKYVKNLDKKFNLIGENQRTEILKDTPGVIKPHDFWPNDTQPELEKYFGKMGQNQTMLQLPYTMQLAWDKDAKIQRFSCHEKVAEALNSIFNRTLDHYGVDGIRELGLDQFGGCLNVRLMRGSDHRYSTHSWGISVDLDPDRNAMRTPFKEARLGQDDAIPFWEIVESTGMQSSGRVRDRDSMHIQACTFSGY